MFDSPQNPAGTDAVEIAQAGASGAESVGSITALQGTVTITRADGTKVQAADGGLIFQGDQIETGANGAIGITFADESSFSLADNGQMTIDEMVYDPGTQSGTSAFGVATGVFTFVSGQIAKTSVDAMTISTPVATIGVRGTAGGGQAGPEGTPNTFTMFAQPGGVVGEMTITTQGGSQTLSSPNQTTQISSAFVPPTLPVTLPPAAIAQFYAKAAAVAPTPIITQPDAGPTGQAGGPAGEATPEQAAEQAAQEAFEQILAEGGSIEDAMAAAVDGATEAGLEAILAVNPDHFGTTGDDVMDNIIDSVLLNVTGGLDPLSAGTGAGPGFSQISDSFFETALAVIEDELGDIISDIFGDIFGDVFGGEGDDFFDSFFDDPFADFEDQFLADDDFGDFGDFGEDPFLETQFFDNVFDDFEDDFDNFVLLLEPDSSNPTVITDVGGVNPSSFALVNNQNDIVIGSTSNDTIVLSGQAEVGDTFDGGGGAADSLELTGTAAANVIQVTNISTLILPDSTFLQAINIASAGAVSITLTNGGRGAIAIAGTSNDGSNLDQAWTFNDVIDGNTVTLDVTGSGGNDSLTMAAGNNVLDVIIGIETINFANGVGSHSVVMTVSNSGITFVSGGLGTGQTLIFGAGTTATATLQGAFTSVTGNGTETLTTTGTTTINLLTGVETLIGGSGTDVVTLADGGTSITINGSIETLTGGGGSDTVTFGSSGATVGNVSLIENFVGGSGTDTITLATGGQTTSVTGVETINGGDGNDAITVTGSTGATITGGAGADVIRGTTAVDTFVTEASGTDNSNTIASNLDAISFRADGTESDILNLTAFTAITEAELDSGGAVQNLGAVIGGNLAAALIDGTFATALNAAGKKSFFTNNGESFLVIESTGNGAFNAGQDFIVKLITNAGAAAVFADISSLADANILGVGFTATVNGGGDTLTLTIDPATDIVVDMTQTVFANVFSGGATPVTFGGTYTQGATVNFNASAITKAVSLTTATTGTTISVVTGSGATTITGAATGGVAVDASALADGTALTFNGSTSSNYTVTNLVGDVVATSSSGTLTVTTLNAAGGTVSITTGTGALTLTLADSAADTITVNVNALTTAGITLSAGSTSTVDVTNYNTTGTLDASALTGDLNVTLGAASQSVTGGSGVDTVTTVASAAGTLDGGTGADILKVGVTLGAATISNFQTLDVTATSNIASASITGMTTLTMAASATLTMTDVQNDQLTGSATVSGVSQQVTLTTAASTTGIAGIETYVLGDFTNTFALVAGQAVIGGTGIDTITASASGNTITGGGGVDVLTGGGGTDTFVYTATTDGSGTSGGDTIVSFAANTDGVTFANVAFGSLGTGALAAAASTAYNTSTAQTITDLAAKADSEIYQVDFDAFAYGIAGGGFLDDLEAAITGGTHTGAAFFLISNSDGSVRLYYDDDTSAGTDGTGLIHMATFTSFNDATIDFATADITIV